jgi:hypothetical protein
MEEGEPAAPALPHVALPEAVAAPSLRRTQQQQNPGFSNAVRGGQSTAAGCSLELSDLEPEPEPEPESETKPEAEAEAEPEPEPEPEGCHARTESHQPLDSPALWPGFSDDVDDGWDAWSSDQAHELGDNPTCDTDESEDDDPFHDLFHGSPPSDSSDDESFHSAAAIDDSSDTWSTAATIGGDNDALNPWWSSPPVGAGNKRQYVAPETPAAFTKMLDALQRDQVRPGSGTNARLAELASALFIGIDRPESDMTAEALLEVLVEHGFMRGGFADQFDHELTSLEMQTLESDLRALVASTSTKRARQAANYSRPDYSPGLTEGEAAPGLTWSQILDMLEGRGELASKAPSQRPNEITQHDVHTRQIFIERPRRRRRGPGVDKWLNSGGKKGSTEHMLDEQVGIIKRYGKIRRRGGGGGGGDGSPAELKFVEFSLTHPSYGESSSGYSDYAAVAIWEQCKDTVVYVVEPTATIERASDSRDSDWSVPPLAPGAAASSREPEAMAVRNYEDFHNMPRGTATLDQVTMSSAGVSGWTGYEGRLDR